MQDAWQEARAILRLGGPVIATQLAQISMNFVDTVMAGQLSARDLAAVAVGGSLWMPIMIFNVGILMSVSPVVSQLFGAGRRGEIGWHVRQALWLSLRLGVLCMFVIRQTGILLTWMQIEPEIIPVAEGYISAVSWGLPAVCAYAVLRCTTESTSLTQPLMWISLLGTLANICGNYVLMYGHFGFPRLGAYGCGVATALSEWLMLAMLTGWMAWYPYYRSMRLFEKFNGPDWREFREILRIGVPIGTSLFMEGSSFAALALLMGTLGTTAVAGHQIALNVASISFMVPLGLSVAISVRVGQAIGRGDRFGARRAGTVGAGLAMAFMALAAVAMLIMPGYITGLYTSDEEVQTMAIGLLSMAALFQLSDGLQVAGAGALRGAKDTKVPMFITLFAYWIVGLPMGYSLGILAGYGPKALWVGPIVGLTAAGLLLMLRFQRTILRLPMVEQETTTPSIPPAESAVRCGTDAG